MPLRSYESLRATGPRRALRGTRRWIGDEHADPLTLWTVQSEDAYRALAEDGALRSDPTHDDDDLAHAYPWMRRMADERLSTTGDTLLWFWARIRRRDLLDQLRRSAGDVLLTVQMPRERVLLTDFSEWHSVLNRGLVIRMKEGEDLTAWSDRMGQAWTGFEERQRKAGVDPWSPVETWPNDLRREIESSWEAILDPSTWTRDPCLQAVVHEIRAEDVVSAVRIGGRFTRGL